MSKKNNSMTKDITYGRRRMVNYLKRHGCRFQSPPSNGQLLMGCSLKLGLEFPYADKRVRFTEINAALIIMGISAGLVKSEKKQQNWAFYKSQAWFRIRYEALQMSQGLCELCGRGKADGIILHVDHVKPRSIYPELALKLGNLQVLCEECNVGKSNLDETDWREPRLATLMGEAV